ncbi:MAG: PTS sugar transporter subunit IIC [Erysipelothrix sp.]|nr:PTS sugar transporter subunit IIC [Erysipelothrix sp.]
MNNNIQEKIQIVAAKISDNAYLKAVTEGLMAILPVMIIGAFSSLLSGMAIAPYQEFITNTGLKPILALPSSYTLDLLAIYAVFFIAYKFASNQGKEGAAGGLIALISFFLLTPSGTLEAGGNALPYQFLGAQGLFVAIIVGLLATRLYILISDLGWVIKMPEGVPPTVSKSFSALIPSVVVAIVFLIISAIFSKTGYGSAHAFIYGLVQTPLQNLSGSLASLIILTLVVHVLWIFGIHGMMVILPIYLSVWVALGAENMAAFEAGVALSEMPNIVNTAYFGVFVLLGGSGATLGLAIYMTFFAKSKRYKTLGRLALPGSIFGINEPLIFGLPIVLNPYLVIPFILAPLANAVIPYFLMSTGIIPKLNGFHLPLGTPAGLSAMLTGTVVILLVQLALVVVDMLIYLPFFRILDKEAIQQELEGDEA